MADVGGSRKDSASSKERIEFKCDPCRRDGKNMSAKSYCRDCGEYICSVCINMHRRFSSTQSHNMTACSTTASERRPELTERCETHPGRIVDTVCRDHNEVCCATCVSVNHRNCEDVVYLPDAAKGVSETDQYRRCIGQLDRIKLNAESTREHRQQDQVRLRKECDAHLTEVKKLCNEARQRIYALETGTESKLRATHDSQGCDLETEIDKCGQVVTEIDDLRAKLSSVDADNEAARFLLMMKVNQLICSTGAASCAVDRTAGAKQAILKLGTRLQSLLDGMGCRAILQAEPMATDTPDGKPLEKGSTIREVGKPSHVGQFHVQVSGEKLSVISGITFLDGGTVVLTDSSNQRLKVLDDTYRVMKHCDLPGEPVGVCATGPHEVCVAMRGMEYVQFVDTRLRMETPRVIYIGTSCWDVASRDGVYVLCGQVECKEHQVECKEQYVNEGLSRKQRFAVDRQVYTTTQYNLEVRVYSSAGKLRRRTCKLAVERQGHSSGSARLAVSGDCARTHVAISDHSVITYNQQGDVLWKYTDSALGYFRGICIGDGDHVYVCGANNNVVQLDSEGNKVRDLLTKDDGIQNPGAVCYDAATGRLLVAVQNVICVFET